MFFNRTVKTIVAAALVLMFTLGLCACGKKGPSEDAFKEAYEKKIDALVEDMGNYYDMVGSYDMTNMSVDAELGIGLSDSLISMLRSNTSYNFDWINDTTIRLIENIKDNKMAMNLGIEYDNNEIASANVIVDSKTESIFVGIPVLSDLFYEQYIGYDVDTDMMAQLQNINIMELLPDEKAVGSLIKKCLSVAIENAGEISYDEYELEINDVTQACTEYVIELSEKEAATIFAEIFKMLKDDMSFEKIVTDFVRAANNSGLDTGYTPSEAYEEIYYEIEDLIEQLEEGIDEGYLSDDTMFVWTSYITDKQEVIGVSVEMPAMNQAAVEGPSAVEMPAMNQAAVEGSSASVKERKTVIFMATAQNKDDVATKIYVKEGARKLFEIDGELVDDGKKLSGTYEIKIEGNSMLFVDLHNVDVKKLEDGYFTGSITLSPSRGLINLVQEETDMDLSVIGLTLGSLSVKLDVEKNDGKSFDAKLSLMSGTEEYIFATVKSSVSEGAKIKIPTDTTQDEDEWLESFDFDNLADSISDSGLPSYIEDLVNGLLYMNSYGYSSY